MVEPVHAGALRPPRAFRWAAFILVVTGLTGWVLYTGMALLDHAVDLFFPSLLVLVSLTGRPLPVLLGRTEFQGDTVVAVRPPGKTVTTPLSQITRIEVRRGLLLEWLVLHRRHGAALQLYGPMRTWLRRDSAFDRGLAELRARTGTVARPRFGLRAITAGTIWTAGVVALILVDPPWQSDSWPGRSHATSLPEPCPVLAATARWSVPGARVDERGNGILEGSRRRACRWIGTGSSGGLTYDRVDELTVEYEVRHRIGWSSGADEAHDLFEINSHPGSGDKAVPVAGVGTEARLIMSAERDFARATVVARRWNVVVTVAHTVDGRGKEEQAARTATEAARSALAAVHFR